MDEPLCFYTKIRGSKISPEISLAPSALESTFNILGFATHEMVASYYSRLQSWPKTQTVQLFLMETASSHNFFFFGENRVSYVFGLTLLY